MKKKETKPKTATDLKEMFAAMQELEKTKGIPMDTMLENIKKSIEKACKSNYNNDDVVFAVDVEKGIFQAYIQKTVVEEVTDPDREVDEKLGRDLDIRAVIGSKVRIPVDTRTSEESPFKMREVLSVRVFVTRKEKSLSKSSRQRKTKLSPLL